MIFVYKHKRSKPSFINIASQTVKVECQHIHSISIIQNIRVLFVSRVNQASKLKVPINFSNRIEEQLFYNVISKKNKKELKWMDIWRLCV